MEGKFLDTLVSRVGMLQDMSEGKLVVSIQEDLFPNMMVLLVGRLEDM